MVVDHSPHTDGDIDIGYLLGIQKEKYVLGLSTGKNDKGLKASLLKSPLNVY